MKINYDKVKEEIANLFSGLGHTISIFDENGKGPISSTKQAKYINVKNIGIMIKLPDGRFDENREVIIYKSSKLDLDSFKDIFTRVRSLSRKHGLSVNLRSFDKEINPKHLSSQVKAKEENRQAISETSLEQSFPHLINYLD